MTHAGRIVAFVFAVLLGVAAVQGCSTAQDNGPAAGEPENPTVALRDGAVQVAEQTVLTLISLDHREPEKGYDRLLGLMTGPAAQEWGQRRAEYVETLVSDVVTSEGAVIDASGVAAFDPAEPSAEVLVAAAAQVSTAQSPVEERRYQLRLLLVQTGDKEWKVSDLQYVS